MTSTPIATRRSHNLLLRLFPVICALPILLGLGWNFGFVGASAMVLECHRPEERARVQSLNDFLVFGTMTFGSFLSGSLLANYGWNTVLWLSFAPLAVAVGALAVAAASRPRPVAG